MRTEIEIVQRHTQSWQTDRGYKSRKGRGKKLHQGLGFFKISHNTRGKEEQMQTEDL